MDNTKKIILLSISMHLALFLSGCIIVPYGYETVSQEVIGARADSNGKVYEQIVNYDKKLNFFVIGFSPDAKFVGYFGYSRYAAITQDSEKTIWAMEHFPSMAWTNVKEAIPIPDSDRWITYEYDILDSDEVDVCLIIFSIQDGKILRQHFERVKRYYPRNAKTICGFYIETNADLSAIRIHETDKISRINTTTGEITIETSDMPPFHAANIDYKKQRELCKQPILKGE